MDDVQGDIDGDPEEQTEDEIVIIPVKDNRSKTVKGFSNKDGLKIIHIANDKEGGGVMCEHLYGIIFDYF